MAFSRCGSYRKDTCYYDEYIAIQYVLNKLNKLKNKLKLKRVERLHLMRVRYFVVGKAIYFTQLDKIISISLKTVRDVQLSIVGSLITLI